MQRQLCHKLLSKISRNASSDSISQNPFISYTLKSNTNPSLYQKSFSRSHSWKLPNLNGVTGGIRNGFLSSSVLSRRIFSRTHLKGQSKGLVNGTVWIQPRRYFHSFDSQYRGWKSVFRRLTTDGVVIGLIITNVAVFMLWRIASPQFMLKNFMISVDNFASGRLHTLVTSAFSHSDMWHLISNMVGLYFFGSSIGRTFGPEYLMKLYLSGTLAGSVFYLVYHAFVAPLYQRSQMPGIDPSKVPGMGASGAVNAIMLLDIFLYPTKTLYIDFIIPVPAVLLGIFLIGNDMLRILEGDRQISGSAHLGGATVAAIAWARNRRGRFGRF
ncbi:RHOMBOID-like protein 12, mitochondrial [Primulina eburnea]|uniref:RHOMBOID-like protein 12, mitochondrial n=1 Tax=Primulina eburnea TaxID=1245227 RepID=UPI003C6C754A